MDGRKLVSNEIENQICKKWPGFSLLPLPGNISRRFFEPAKCVAAVFHHQNCVQSRIMHMGCDIEQRHTSGGFITY
jgi:hypothetical protein